MAMFLLHIAFLLALALVVAGLVLWHQGHRTNAALLRVGGGILTVGAVLSALCVAYYGIRYHVQGDFDHAYVAPAPMEMGRMMRGGMMKGGMMGGGMMERGRGRGPMGPPETARPDTQEEMAAPPGVSESEHEAHHPEGAAP